MRPLSFQAYLCHPMLGPSSISFKMYSRSTVILALLSSAIQALPSKKTTFATPTVEALGIGTDPTSNTNGVFHDGGGGATQNGYHVQVYADSFTTDQGFNFVHNSVGYFGYVRAAGFCSQIRLLTGLFSGIKRILYLSIPLA